MEGPRGQSGSRLVTTLSKLMPIKSWTSLEKIILTGKEEKSCLIVRLKRLSLKRIAFTTKRSINVDQGIITFRLLVMSTTILFVLTLILMINFSVPLLKQI